MKDLKINKNTVITVETKKEYDQICFILNELGCTWSNGDKYTKKSIFKKVEYAEDILCIDPFDGTHDILNDMIMMHGKSIIPGRYFIKLHKDIIENSISKFVILIEDMFDEMIIGKLLMDNGYEQKHNSVFPFGEIQKRNEPYYFNPFTGKSYDKKEVIEYDFKIVESHEFVMGNLLTSRTK